MIWSYIYFRITSSLFMAFEEVALRVDDVKVRDVEVRELGDSEDFWSVVDEFGRL